MNIDEYRALKAQMEKETSGQKDPKPTGTQSPEPGAVKDGEKQAKTTTGNQSDDKGSLTDDKQPKKNDSIGDKFPEFIEIDGKKVPIEELKNGYLRQSDYTRKTQQLRRKEEQLKDVLKFVEEIQQHPQVAQTLAEQFKIPAIDPKEMQFQELQDRYFELFIDNELMKLHSKYGDFNDAEVLEMAKEKGIEDLEVAYHMVQHNKGGGTQQPELNLDDLKKQLRNELLEELKREQMASADTASIIPTGGGVAPKETTPSLSQSELKVARNMGMSPEEYVKWRDAGRKKRR